MAVGCGMVCFETTGLARRGRGTVVFVGGGCGAPELPELGTRASLIPAVMKVLYG